MKWQQGENLPWREPLAMAAELHGQDIALLYSGLREAQSGRYSYLFANPIAHCSGDTWDSLPAMPDVHDDLPYWVGFLGYGLRENPTIAQAASIPFPHLHFTRYAQLWRFDHDAKTVNSFVADDTLRPLPSPKAQATSSKPVRTISSNFTRAAYESAVAKTVEAIHAGEFYQANLTRKFYGEFSEPPDSFDIYAKLCAASPAPYSAYIRHGARSILSSSPECFLSMDASGRLVTRPIKGSARRSDDAAADNIARAKLAGSEKNLAENLMIVDLMRNDLSRVCEPGSVTVSEQSGLYSYATIHHLISTITGQKRRDCSTSEVLQACFPPGSMTGAPKIAAMRWCEHMEGMERGVYSGAIGWLGGDSTCDFSVVIRTLLIEGERFEFQVGGGIVADSDPTDEWRETLTKARGVLAALGLDEEDIARL